MTAKLGRLALCYGTRPQIVKASALAEALEDDWDLLCMDTGQHYDWELNGLHYEQLGVRPPDRFLEVKSGGHAAQTAAVMMRTDEALTEYEPDVVLVIGDTNSTLGCALAAVKRRTYLVHVEAGLRARDLQMAEEINRRVVDEISSLLCAPSMRATDFLAGRISKQQTVAFTGDVARDVLERARARPTLPKEPWAEKGIGEPFVLTTLHRAELTSRRAAVASVLDGLDALPYPVFFPAHPRTVAVLEEFGLEPPDNVVLSEPIGYLDMVAWTQGAEAVVTDSGGLQREAYWMGVPCVTMRGESEWTETVDEGANILLPPEEAASLPGILAEHVERRGEWDGEAYGMGQAAEAVRALLRRQFGGEG